MAKGYIDETGIHIPTYNEIFSDLSKAAKKIYGEDLYLEPDSKDGQWLSVFALSVYDAYSLAVSVYNSFSPSTARGAGLSRIVRLNGLERKTATPSVVELKLTGLPGTVINRGVVEDISGVKWDLPEEVVIPIDGECFVSAVSREEGAVQATPGSVTKITTPVRGWHRATNPSAATVGRDAESDADLRKRQQISTAQPSMMALEGIIGGVAAVEGVKRIRGYQNDTGATDTVGIPAHSIAVVVEGGDAENIASAIALRKSPGTGTVGAILVQVADRYGVINAIRFMRPEHIDVGIKIKLRALSGYSATLEKTIKQNVADAINSAPIGESIYLSHFFGVVLSSEDGTGKKTFDISEIFLSARGGEYIQQSLVLPYNGLPLVDIENVEIVLV